MPLSAGEQGIARLRRRAEQQEPRDPASRLWLARRGLSTAQNTDLHAARLVAGLKFSATATSFVMLTVDLRARHTLSSTNWQRLSAVDMMDNASALPTCPQRQKQPQTADRNGLKITHTTSR